MRADTLLGAAGLVLVVSGLLIPAFTGSTESTRYTVNPGEVLQVKLSLEKRERVVGFFSVGGEPPEIGFSVVSPAGRIVGYALEPPANFVAPGVVTGWHNFNFLAEERGDYVLVFNNTAYSSKKSIRLRLARTPAQLGIHPTNLLILLGFALIFLRYVVDELLEKRYKPVGPEDFEYLGNGVFGLRDDPGVRVKLGNLPSELEAELRRFGYTPRSRIALYNSLRKMAEEK